MAKTLHSRQRRRRPSSGLVPRRGVGVQLGEVGRRARFTSPAPLTGSRMSGYSVRTVPRGRANAKLPPDAKWERRSIAGYSDATRATRDRRKNAHCCGACAGRRLVRERTDCGVCRDCSFFPWSCVPTPRRIPGGASTSSALPQRLSCRGDAGVARDAMSRTFAACIRDTCRGTLRSASPSSPALPPRIARPSDRALALRVAIPSRVRSRGFAAIGKGPVAVFAWFLALR